MEDVYICSAFRTPIGSFNGQYSNIPASTLGSVVLFHCLRRAEVDPKDVSEVIMGQVLTSGQGQNPARQAAVLAGLPPSVPATTINMLTGSGLRAIFNGYNAIRIKEASIVLAGGQENMSMSEHCVNLRNEKKQGNIEIVDTMLHDGLTCPFLNMHMGTVAEHLATAFQIPRITQDKYALMSQLRTSKALEQGAFINEVVQTHENLSSYNIIVDEFPRKNSSLEILAELKPSFKPQDGTITSGNSTGLSDGAAAVLLASRSEVIKRNMMPQVKIIAMAQVGCEPIQMGLAPVAAIKKVLEEAEWCLKDVDLFEINEAFAVETMLVVNILDIDFSKVNVSGGAIALGQPLACAGVRMLVTMVHNMERLEKDRGIVTLSIGGGMAVAMAVHRCMGVGAGVQLVNNCRFGLEYGDYVSPKKLQV